MRSIFRLSLARSWRTGMITTGPPDPLLTIVNKVLTSPKGTRRDIIVYRGLGADDWRLQGSIALDDRGYTGGLGISHPALLFAYLLRCVAGAKGVSRSPGKTRTVLADSSRRRQRLTALTPAFD